MHFVVPLNYWSGSTNSGLGGFDLSTVRAARIAEYDTFIPATNSTAGTNNAMWLDVGFANIVLSGAPAWAPVFSGLSSHSVATGATSVTLTGRVSAIVAGTNVYCWTGTPVSVTINGNTQTGAINDATGDFSVNYNPSALLPNTYTVTYSVPADMVELVGATNSATSLTVGAAPPPTPTIKVSRSGNSLVLTVPNSASGYSYYLLTTTNLHPPVVWITNSTTAGTGGTITNMVNISPTPPQLFLKYLVQ